MNDYESLQEAEQKWLRRHISLAALLFGEAVWMFGGVVCLTFAEVLGAKLMLLLGSVLTLLSIGTTWFVGSRWRAYRGVPTLLESLVREVTRLKQANAGGNGVPGLDRIAS